MSGFCKHFLGQSVIVAILNWNGASAIGKQPQIVIDVNVTPIVTVAIDGNVAHFSCKKVQWPNQSGEPQIPWQVINVLLPPDAVLATVDVRLRNGTFEKVSGSWEVAPTPPVATHVRDHKKVYWPKGKRIVDGRDADIYEMDTVWPHLDVKLISAGQLRKWKLAQVALPLIRYNPVWKNMRRLVGGQLEIYFDRAVLAHSDPTVIA